MDWNLSSPADLVIPNEVRDWFRLKNPAITRVVYECHHTDESGLVCICEIEMVGDRRTTQCVVQCWLCGHVIPFRVSDRDNVLSAGTMHLYFHLMAELGTCVGHLNRNQAEGDEK